MPERIFIRDPFDGKSKEDELFVINQLNELFKKINTKIEAIANNVGEGREDEIDIALFKEGLIIAYIEVEGTHADNWNNTERPEKWGRKSNLMTMPLRKIKYFIEDNSALIKRESVEVKEFIKIYGLDNPKVKLKVNTDLPRFWIKISHCRKFFCICYKDEIVEKINQEYYYPDKRYKNHEGYYRNLWFNPFVTNYKGELRSEQTQIVLGKIYGDELYFGEFEGNDLYNYLKRYIRDIDE
jgi:hypothetical protein